MKGHYSSLMQFHFFQPKVRMSPAGNTGNAFRLKEGKCHRGSCLHSDGDFSPCISWCCCVEAAAAPSGITRACAAWACQGCYWLQQEMSQKRLREKVLHLGPAAYSSQSQAATKEACHILTVSQSWNFPSLGFSKVSIFLNYMKRLVYTSWSQASWMW